MSCSENVVLINGHPYRQCNICGTRRDLHDEAPPACARYWLSDRIAIASLTAAGVGVIVLVIYLVRSLL